MIHLNEGSSEYASPSGARSTSTLHAAKPEHTSPGLSEQPTASAQVKLVALVTINKMRQNNNRIIMHNNNRMITQPGTDNNKTSE